MGMKKDRKAIRKKRHLIKLYRKNFLLKLLHENEDLIIEYYKEHDGAIGKSIFPENRNIGFHWIKGRKESD